jgi:hypothetical protein
MPPPHSWNSNDGESKKNDPLAFSFAEYCHGGRFSFYREVKTELADLLMSQGSLMTNLEGVVQTISINESATDFRRKMDCCKKYVQISSDLA